MGNAVSASSSFCTLAGRRRRCGSQAPRIAPVSRSATTHDCADVAGGAFTAAGAASPVVASPAPPTTGAAASRGGDAGVGGIVGGVTCGHGTIAAVVGDAGLAVGNATGAASNPALTSATATLDALTQAD
ncbi:hypothetical protein Raf01_40210 [Rugosimonospora africana]|uniref:Uncharacterized protein n=1 Tax=Rugosimonospora africana TaxID=556532 RepID=A0A8J3VR80_9ACTN|nr:hypothetical protein Raf01_40210 [Rugosimonospora africana]